MIKKRLTEAGGIGTKSLRLFTFLGDSKVSRHAVPVNFTPESVINNFTTRAVVERPESSGETSERLIFQGRYLHFNCSSLVQITPCGQT